jgi:ACT domain-containing protein
VTDSGLQPLSKADVAVVGSTVANQTDRDGRFVLYFTSLTDEDVQVQNGRRRITVSGSTTLRLQATKANYQSTTVTIGEVEEGSTKLVRDPILMVAS